MFSEYGKHDALGLAELVAQRQVSASELCEICIARIEKVNHALNAVITPMYDDARAVARAMSADPPSGPFAGVPFLVKDLVASVKGVRFTRGSRFFADDIAPADSELIARYRKAGLVLVAKTNTPEFGLKPMTEPELHGPTQNPWRHGHTAGGSSGGSAAMVAARVVPMAHGGDGGGSLRIPAACCGIFSMKPTRARTPAGPDASESWFGFAIEHAMTLSVRDNAALLDATSAPAHDAPYAAPKPERPFLEETRRDPGKLRIAVCRTPFLPGDPEPAVLHALDDAAKLCRELGHEIEEVGPAIDRDQFAVDFTTLVAVATAVDIDEGERVVGRKATHRDFETNTWVVSQIGRNLDAVQVESARRRLLTMSRSVAGFMQRYDAMLTPTLGQSPPRHGALTPPPWLQKAEELIAKTGARAVLKIPGVVEMAAKQTYQFIPYTPLANVTGQPSMNVPLYWEDGLPQGVNFSARHGDEATLYRLAAQLELARPWRDKIPPVNAA